MAKLKTAYFCQNCGAQYSKWQGQCYTCKQWNTIVEEVVQKDTAPAWQEKESPIKNKASKYIPISQIDTQQEPRLNSNNHELNNVLGGGIVPGSVTLLGGEPGIGKSTLLLQIALNLPYRTLYVSGEESEKQIKMRADRIPHKLDNCFILTETKTQNIFQQIKELLPEIVIIDSIQTLQSDYIEASAGSISQIRECTSELIKFAKTTHTPVILIGHITKDGQIAGPKILEHMVDTVLQFEGDQVIVEVGESTSSSSARSASDAENTYGTSTSGPRFSANNFGSNVEDTFRRLQSEPAVQDFLSALRESEDGPDQGRCGDEQHDRGLQDQDDLDVGSRCGLHGGAAGTQCPEQQPGQNGSHGPGASQQRDRDGVEADGAHDGLVHALLSAQNRRSGGQSAQGAGDHHD